VLFSRETESQSIGKQSGFIFKERERERDLSLKEQEAEDQVKVL
jgi:hypothetical protein